MIKQLNRILKLVGFNLVRAKRKKTKWQKVPPYTREELENAAVPRNCATPADHDWQSGKTHYVGDDCPGGHHDLDVPRVEQPNSDNKIGGPTS